MGSWFTLYTLVAFLIGVFASGTVMAWWSNARSTVAGG